MEELHGWLEDARELARQWPDAGNGQDGFTFFEVRIRARAQSETKVGMRAVRSRRRESAELTDRLSSLERKTWQTSSADETGRT